MGMHGYMRQLRKELWDATLQASSTAREYMDKLDELQKILEFDRTLFTAEEAAELARLAVNAEAKRETFYAVCRMFGSLARLRIGAGQRTAKSINELARKSIDGAKCLLDDNPAKRAYGVYNDLDELQKNFPYSAL